MTADRPALGAFLRAAAATPFRHGVSDCGKTLGAWIKARTGTDPFADLAYDSAFGWKRRAAAAGGLDALVASRLDGLGLKRTANPKPGDAALVTTPLGVTCAIRATKGYAVKVDDRIAVGDFPLIAAWEVG